MTAAACTSSHAARRTDRLVVIRARTFAEFLIDCEEDWTLQAVLLGMLREGDRR
jgi:hypothetical protein